jgi:hypothetical protein
MAAVCGCARTGTVRGTVTVDGKPAVGATVVFSGGENQSALAAVHDDGTFQTPGVPIGPVKVAVKSSPMPYLGRFSGAMAAPKRGGPGAENLLPFDQQPSTPPAIPKRYTDADTSGLTLTVTRGRNEFNIAMTSR